MSKVVIKANPDFNRGIEEGVSTLFVAEMFGDTIQGEGVNTGVPATFIRLQGCTLNCSWCDSESVWRYGNPYSVNEVCSLLETSGLVDKMRDGQHLVLTGGSPLKQQFDLVELIKLFISRFGFKPYIEIENESVLRPLPELINFIDCWNNSPKLESSGNTKRAQYKPELLKQLSNLDNSWFKFVITDEEDWMEIERDFVKPNLIRREQIILMPEGATRNELNRTRELTVNIAIRERVRYSDRLHIVLWDKKTGV